MTNEYVKFPNMFSGEIKINRVLIDFMGLEIYWYGALITIGAALGFIYVMRRAKSFGMIPEAVFDIVFAGAIGGFIGARAYYCIFQNLNPTSGSHYTIITAITHIRDGGLAIYGGVIGSVLCAFVYARIRKLRILPVFDLAGPAFLIGQAIGRWGNFFNQEAYGAATAGDLPWGMTGSKIASGSSLVHPCFLYESLWCCIGFFVLHFYSKKFRSFDGEIILLYAAWYGTGRGFIEGLRTDSLYIGSFRVSQLLAVISAATAVILLVYFKARCLKNGDNLYCLTDESKKAIENFEKEIILQKEKTAAIKALKNSKGD